MELSYWEYKTWLSNIDFTIVGSGIVGLTTAIFLRERFPKSKILILEKGTLPQGASTKNAGFACFGSISEVMSDLRSHSEEEVFDLVKQRWLGIQLLRQLLGDKALNYEAHGGHEIFPSKDDSLFDSCIQKIDTINEWLQPIFKGNPFMMTENTFGFQNIQPKYVTHRFEGQLDTGKMMKGLLNLAQKKEIQVLNAIEVVDFVDGNDGVLIKTNAFKFKTKELCIATNGFAKQLLNEAVKPARAQVLTTKPIKNLHVKGTFHFDEGYYYFRNIDDRILFGGGRNLDLKGESTTEMKTTDIIQNKLERLLSEVILPNTPFEIERRWSGIMGIGSKKRPIIKQVSDNVFCGIRLGGMGVAMGSLVGKKLADLL